MAHIYLVFGNIEGKLDVLRVECTKCPRKGRHHVRKLIEKYGRKAHGRRNSMATVRSVTRLNCTTVAT